MALNILWQKSVQRALYLTSADDFSSIYFVKISVTSNTDNDGYLPLEVLEENLFSENVW